MSYSPILYAYVITSKEDGRRYVGLSKAPDARWGSHLFASRQSKKPRSPIQEAIAAKGAEAFSFETVACAISVEAAKHLEDILIRQHRSRWPAGYNVNSSGGPGPCLELRDRKPRPQNGGARVDLWLADDLADGLDFWRSHEPGVPNRTSAVRRIIQAAIEQRRKEVERVARSSPKVRAAR